MASPALANMPSLIDVGGIHLDTSLLTPEQQQSLVARLAPPAASNDASGDDSGSFWSGVKDFFGKSREHAQAIEKYRAEQEQKQRENATQVLGGAADWLRSATAHTQDSPEQVRLRAAGLLPPMAPAPAPTPLAAPPPAPPADMQALADREAQVSAGTPPAARPVPAVQQPGTGGSGQTGNVAQPKQPDAYRQLEQAIQEGANTGARQAAEVAAYREHTAQSMEEWDAQRQAREETRQRAMAGAEKFMNGAVADYNSISTKVDPNRFWANKSNAQKVTAGIGIMLSGIGAALQHSDKNMALEAINKAIEDDLDAQKTQMEASLRKGATKVEFAKTSYGMLLQKFGDERSAESAERVIKLSNAQYQLENVAARYGSEQTKAAAAKGIAEIEVQKRQHMEELRLRQAELSIKKMEAAADLLKTQTADKAASQKQNELKVGDMGYAYSAGDASEARKMLGAHNEFMSQLEGLIAFRNKHGGSFSPSAISEGKTMLGDAKIAYNHAKKLGTLDKGSMEVLEDVFGKDLTQFGYVMPKLEALKRTTQRGFEGQMRAYLDSSTTGASSGATTLRKR